MVAKVRLTSNHGRPLNQNGQILIAPQRQAFFNFFGDHRVTINQNKGVTIPASFREKIVPPKVFLLFINLNDKMEPFFSPSPALTEKFIAIFPEEYLKNKLPPRNPYKNEHHIFNHLFQEPIKDNGQICLDYVLKIQQTNYSHNVIMRGFGNYMQLWEEEKLSRLSDKNWESILKYFSFF